VLNFSTSVPALLQGVAVVSIGAFLVGAWLVGAVGRTLELLMVNNYPKAK
jgi:hypothetical protein